MASKWQHLKGKIPDAPVGDMTNAADKKFIERVDALKFNYATLTLPELMALFTGFNVEWDEVEARKKELNAEFEALGALLRAKFEEANVNSMRSNDGQNFYLSIEPYVGVEDKAKFEDWLCQQPDLDYLLGVHPQSLASLVKGYLEAGQDDQIPPHLKIFLKTQVRVRKS